MESNFTCMPVPPSGRRDLLTRATYLEATDQAWSEAPAAVVLARKIAIASTALYSLGAGTVIGDIVVRNQAVSAVSFLHFVLVGACLLLALVNLWLIGGLTQGRPAAWIVQRLLSCVSLAIVPLGTFVHLLLLLRWSRFESKAWFIVR